MRFEPFPISSLVGAFLIGFPALFSIVNPAATAMIFYNLTARFSHRARARSSCSVLRRTVASRTPTDRSALNSS